MKKPFRPKKVFYSAGEDVGAARLAPETAQTLSPSYRLAYTDDDFLLRDELRPVRLQLELLKPDLVQDDHGIHSTVVIFGSARIPDREAAAEGLKKAEEAAKVSPADPKLARQVNIARRVLSNTRYYDEARKLASMITTATDSEGHCNLLVITGGGPGIMEAANRGAMDVGGKSIGLNIVLPFEQRPNAYVTPELCFQFHYFAIRKMHFLKRARALIACPGGFGTLDELFETLTLIQTKKISAVPVLLLGRDYWSKAVNFNMLVEEGMIEEEDLSLFDIVDTAEEAWEYLENYWDTQ